VIRHPAVTAIPGASGVEQLDGNVSAADIELADEEYTALITRWRPCAARRTRTGEDPSRV